MQNDVFVKRVLEDLNKLLESQTLWPDWQFWSNIFESKSKTSLGVMLLIPYIKRNESCISLGDNINHKNEMVMFLANAENDTFEA